jgi:hypothetical protein
MVKAKVKIVKWRDRKRPIWDWDLGFRILDLKIVDRVDRVKEEERTTPSAETAATPPFPRRGAFRTIGVGRNGCHLSLSKEGSSQENYRNFD